MPLRQFAPKDRAVPCQECHTHAEDGRLTAITDIYLPGRDRNSLVDMFGSLAIVGAIGAGAIHGLARLIARRKESAK